MPIPSRPRSSYATLNAVPLATPSPEKLMLVPPTVRVRVLSVPPVGVTVASTYAGRLPRTASVPEPLVPLAVQLVVLTSSQ